MRKSILKTIVAMTIGLTAVRPAPACAFCFEEAALRYNIAPVIIRGIAENESQMDPYAVNYNSDGTYDYGVMQINSIHEPTFRKLGIPWDCLADPCTNVMSGTWLLSLQIREYGYTWKAIGAYHSKTPSKRDRYARKIAKTVFRLNGKLPQNAANLQMETVANKETLVWGTTDVNTTAP